MSRIYRWILFVTLLALLLLPAAGVSLAQSGSPTAQTFKADLPQGNAGVPWYVGVLLLVAIFTGLTIYKNRYQATRKKTVLNAACCAPIIEDGDDPFHPADEGQEQQS